MKPTSAFLICLICFIELFACNKNNENKQTDILNNTSNTKMKITIGTTIFTATFYNNATATAFKAKLPMTVNMTELNGNEKYFDLPNSLPTNASNPGTIQTGDVMLYGSNTLVLFYKTYSTSYNYSRIGHIENPTGLADALGAGNITLKFELE